MSRKRVPDAGYTAPRLIRLMTAPKNVIGQRRQLLWSTVRMPPAGRSIGLKLPQIALLDENAGIGDLVLRHCPIALKKRADASIAYQFEAMLAPKPIWKTAKMPEDVLARLMRMIVPCEMDVSEVEATWKLGQNKTEAVRLAAAEKAEAALIGQEVAELAALMREPPEL